MHGHPWLQLSFQQDARCSDLLHACKQTLGDLISDLPHMLISAATLKVPSGSLHDQAPGHRTESHIPDRSLSLFLSLLSLPSVLSPTSGPLLCYSFTSPLPGLPSLWCLRSLLFSTSLSPPLQTSSFHSLLLFFLLRSSLVVSTSPSSSSVDSCLSRGGDLCTRPRSSALSLWLPSSDVSVCAGVSGPGGGARRPE